MITAREERNERMQLVEHCCQLAELIHMMTQNAIASNAPDGWLLTLASELSEKVRMEACAVNERA